MRKLIILISVMLFLCGNVCGQSIHRLKIGIKVPEVTFTILKDGKYKTAKLSDFKGKLVILDYWNIWCGSCIEAFPKLARLQKKYPSEIVILPVSFLHTKSVIRDFIAKRKGTDDEIELPVAVFENKNNTLFRSLPTSGYPHEIWIDKNGDYLTPSDPADITESNISAVLKGTKVDFKPKVQQLGFNWQLPILIDNNGAPDSAFSYRSLITPHIAGIGKIGGKPLGGSGKTKLHFSLLNYSILELAKNALWKGKNNDVYNHYVSFEGNDSLRKRIYYESQPLKAMRKWQNENYYCYDLTVPQGFTISEAYEFMHQDIDRFFRIQTSIENRPMDCLVLKRVDNIDRIATKSGAGKYKKTKDEIELVNQNLNYLLSSLDSRQTPLLIDETGYMGKVDIKISHGREFNMDFLNTQLQNYGLKFEEAQRVLPVIVVKQKSNGS